MKPAYRRSDGSVESANTPTRERLYKDLDSRIFKVLITKVFYTDNSRNLSFGGQNPEVIYEGVTIGGKTEGRSVINIRDASYLSGGKNNYSERIYRAASRPISGETSTPLNKQDGDVVYVAFINGDPQFPIIVGAATHPLDADNTGATKEDGPVARWEYNGIFFKVDKGGNMTLTRKGGEFKSKEGYFEPEADGDKVTFKIEAQKMTTTFGKDVIKKTEDGDNEKVTLEFKSGLKMEYDGKNDKVLFTLQGGVEVLADGKSKLVTLTAGETKVNIDGNSGKVHIDGDLVDVGKSVSDLAVLFTELASAFDAHTHMFPYNAGPSPAVGTTQPPTAPLLQSVASKSVKLQS